MMRMVAEKMLIAAILEIVAYRVMAMVNLKMDEGGPDGRGGSGYPNRAVS